MIDEEFIPCPICEAILIHIADPVWPTWACRQCGASFAAYELAHEPEPAPDKPNAAGVFL